MSNGPYKTDHARLAYKGNKIFHALDEVRKNPAPDFKDRCQDIASRDYWISLIRLWSKTFQGINEFVEKREVLLFDLPILTRMISSPGALTGTIVSDVDPFSVKFFDHQAYLTQSSQLYLEFALTVPSIKEVYCWEKSFRRERADFRHLPEFVHVEYEGLISFGENLLLQTDFLNFLINYLLSHGNKELTVFLNESEIEELRNFTKQPYERITFHEAFEKLYRETGNKKYKQPSIVSFGAWEEVLLTQIMGNRPVFVTHYISDEVAFYHQDDPDNPGLVLNADFLFPGYGELIGSGQRVGTEDETRRKAEHFQLNQDDYEVYIKSRAISNATHSGWGMGIERFLQATLRLPFIWEVKPFPRVDTSIRP